MSVVEPFTVPSADVMADMSDEELTAIQLRCQACVDSCTESIDDKEARGVNADGIRNARRHYARGVRAVTAYHSLKAVNRLLGLCEAEHRATAAFLAEDSDANWERLEAAHETVERALRDGGEAS